MAYRIKRREKFAKGVRRVVREQLKRATGAAKAVEGEQEERVHEVRTRLKRSRAALAMIEQRAGRNATREMRRLRDTARRLAKPRDIAVQAHTFRILRTQLPAALSPRLEARLDLAERQMRRSLDPDKIERDLRRTARALKQVRRRTGPWKTGPGRRAVADGVTEMYKRARAALERVRSHPTPERLHDWRKRVKALWYQLQIVGRAVPELATLLAPKVERLGEILGQIHDLDCAKETIETHERWFGPPAEREALLAIVEEWRAGLERDAFTLAETVFAGRPRDVRALIETGWRSWRHPPRQQPATPAPHVAAYMQ
jgi:CHAD domain-containing protein